MKPSIIDRKQRLANPEQIPPTADPAIRRHTWDEVSLGYTAEQAEAEAARCLSCPAAPCCRACPLHNDVAGALQHVSAGSSSAATALFYRTSPFPDICSRLCPQERLCQGACVVGKRSAPVHIGHIERYVTDAGMQLGLPRLAVRPDTGRAAAIIGAGPAGLAAAEDLRCAGHRVVVFDRWPLPGGVLRYGIPAFKLPKSVIDAKWRQLAQAGVTFAQRSFDRSTQLSSLKDEGFDAILITIGAGASSLLGIPGQDLAGVFSATDFLVRANVPSNELPRHYAAAINAGSAVVVVGGGDTAMDCCRTAVRLGAASVLCMYRRTESDMPGRAVERQYAYQEGVQFAFLTSPIGVRGEDGNVCGVECLRMQPTSRDSSGRWMVSPLDAPPFVVPASSVVVATGYHVDEEIDDFAPGIERRADGTVIIDSLTGHTNLPDVFAAGDVASGPDLVVTAVASGRRAARAICEAFQARASLVEECAEVGAQKFPGDVQHGCELRREVVAGVEPTQDSW